MSQRRACWAAVRCGWRQPGLGAPSAADTSAAGRGGRRLLSAGVTPRGNELGTKTVTPTTTIRTGVTCLLGCVWNWVEIAYMQGSVSADLCHLNLSIYDFCISMKNVFIFFLSCCCAKKGPSSFPQCVGCTLLINLTVSICHGKLSFLSLKPHPGVCECEENQFRRGETQFLLLPLPPHPMA